MQRQDGSHNIFAGIFLSDPLNKKPPCPGEQGGDLVSLIGYQRWTISLST